MGAGLPLYPGIGALVGGGLTETGEEAMWGQRDTEGGSHSRGGLGPPKLEEAGSTLSQSFAVSPASWTP